MAPAAPAVPGDDDWAWPPDAVEVGRVVGAWGIRGALKVQPHAADPQGLYATKRWYLAAPAAPSSKRTPGWRRLLKVISARAQGDTIVVTAQGLEDRDAALELAGARIHVARSSFPTPQPDEYYWVDLIGLDVVNRAGVALGRVTGLRDTGPHCVLCLDASDSPGGERLIPFVAAYVDSVDRVAKRIVVDWEPDF